MKTLSLSSVSVEGLPCGHELRPAAEGWKERRGPRTAGAQDAAPARSAGVAAWAGLVPYQTSGHGSSAAVRLPPPSPCCNTGGKSDRGRRGESCRTPRKPAPVLGLGRYRAKVFQLSEQGSRLSGWRARVLEHRLGAKRPSPRGLRPPTAWAPPKCSFEGGCRRGSAPGSFKTALRGAHAVGERSFQGSGGHPPSRL
jgi:hypothetical protein